MAPTTIPGQITTTSPSGRGNNFEGPPLRVCELLATLDAPAYIERTSLNNKVNIEKTKAAIKKAFKYQMQGKGYTFIEVLSACPTNWHKSMKDSLAFLNEMEKYFPLGVFKDKK